MSWRTTVAVLSIVAVLAPLAVLSCGSDHELTNLTGDPVARDEEPAWSPDGSSIVFVSRTFHDEPGYAYVESWICVMDANGENRRKLLRADGASHPSWSPDGDKIIYAVGSFGIFATDLDGTAPERVIEVVPDSVYTIYEFPSYSPDGSKIIYSGHVDGGRQIFVLDLDTRETTSLTPEGLDEQPAWSPDGTRIAFVSELRDNPNVWVMDADGGNRKRLTEGAFGDLYPSWSPDETSIAFVRASRDDGSDIYIMDADGGNMTRLTSGLRVKGPKWSPDGTRIVFAGVKGDLSSPESTVDIYTVDVPADMRQGRPQYP